MYNYLGIYGQQRSFGFSYYMVRGWWLRMNKRHDSRGSGRTICPTSVNDRQWYFAGDAKCMTSRSVPLFCWGTNPAGVFGLYRNDSQCIPPGVKSLYQEKELIPAHLVLTERKIWERRLRLLTSHRVVRMLVKETLGFTVVCWFVFFYCFTLDCVNWLLLPAGSNVNTLMRHSRDVSFPERLNVPACPACTPKLEVRSLMWLLLRNVIIYWCFH